MKIQNSGYSHHGASRTKASMLSWPSSSRSPHEDISDNLKLLRERSRDLYAGGGPLGRGAIDRLALNALGSGLKLNVRIDPDMLGMNEEESRQWSAKTEAEFDWWASSKSASNTGTLNFYELQVLAFRSLLLDGDCLVMLSDKPNAETDYELSVALIESERLKNPPSRPSGVMIDEGVELDSAMNPAAYWITNVNPNSEISGRPQIEYMRIPATGKNSGRRIILQLMNPERIGQNRGVPFLAPVIEQLKQLGRYTDAELMAAVISGITR